MEKVGHHKVKVLTLDQSDDRHDNSIAIDRQLVGSQAEPSKDLPQKRMERELEPDLTDGHKGHGNVLGTLLHRVLDLIAL